jgi:acyl-CoA synthetase (AMP-forming)/AMP-acid ligase II
VDPETHRRCPEGRVGEIWVAGGSVARGYWNRGEDTDATFGARLTDTGEGPFLRTGDLGFLRGEELFVTGRLKDVIIVRGRNHYPQDIERTVETCDPAFRPGCGAAFAVPVGTTEQLVVVQEVDAGRAPNPGAWPRGVVRELADQHSLRAHAIVLVQRGTIPKTTSGKVRRRACRELYLADRLAVVARWPPPPATVEA